MCRPNALFFNIHPSFATAVHTEIPNCSNDPIRSFWYYQILMFLFSEILSSCFRSFIFLLPSYFSMASVYITLTCWKSLNSQLSETRREITCNSYLSLWWPFPLPPPWFYDFSFGNSWIITAIEQMGSWGWLFWDTYISCCILWLFSM